MPELLCIHNTFKYIIQIKYRLQVYLNCLETAQACFILFLFLADSFGSLMDFTIKISKVDKMNKIQYLSSGDFLGFRSHKET